MRIKYNHSGFSLLELVVVLLVLTTIMGIVFSLLNGFQQSYRYEEAYADAQRNARFAVARLNEVIRSAGTNPRSITTVNQSDFLEMLEPTTTHGTEISSEAIRLRSDLDGDTLNATRISLNSDVIVVAEDLTLRLNQTTRQIVMDDNTVSPAISIPIADNIRSIRFTDPAGSARTHKAIRIEVVAVPSGIEEGDPRFREVIYGAMIRLRNR